MPEALKTLAGTDDLAEIIALAQDIARISQLSVVKSMAAVIKELAQELITMQDQNKILLAQLADCEISKAVLREAMDDPYRQDEPDEDDLIAVVA